MNGALGRPGGPGAGESTVARSVMERVSRGQSGSRDAAVKRPQVKEGRQAERLPQQSRGTEPWTRLFGSGKWSCSSGETDGSWSGSMESADPAGSCVLFDPPESSTSKGALEGGSYRLCFDFKCAHAAPASGHIPAFSLVCGLRKGRNPTTSSGKGRSSADEILCVQADCSKRRWVVEQHRKDIIVEEQFFEDRELRPGSEHSLRLEVRAGDLSLFCREREIATGLPLLRAGTQSEGGAFAPSIGFYVCKARLQFWNLTLTGVAAKDQVAGAVVKYTGDDSRLTEIVERDMIQNDLGVTFDDIASLDEAKRLLHEAVTLPLIIPEFFTGIREPWKGVLLFGPPGTGKTLLARAVATMNNIKFFNCGSSTLVSKWRGESEKLVRVLFDMARHYAPSIIFFDEMDALVSSRGADSEHEASRRFKSELLAQMDGLTSGAAAQEGRNVMVLATTNCPWDVDEAMRRRLEKRIYIPLPLSDSRRKMFEIHLRGVVLGPDVSLDDLAGRTEGFSGADIKLVCRDASMAPMRRLVLDKTPEEIRALKEAGQLECDLTAEDFGQSLARTKPSVCDTDRYEAWNAEFAST